MTYEEVRSALFMTAQAVTIQAQARAALATRGVEAHMNCIRVLWLLRCGIL